MNNSSQTSITQNSLKPSVQQPNPIFVCCNDHTIQIKDHNINVTIQSVSSAHTTTDDAFKSLEIKSQQQPTKTQDNKNKCIHHKNEDSVGYCEEEREYLCQGCFERHQRRNHQEQIQDNRGIELDYHCKEHCNFKLSSYCNECQTNICAECKGSNHQTHNTFNVTDLLQDNFQECIESIDQGEKEFYDDALQKYNSAKGQLDSLYQRYIKINADLFGIVKCCFRMYEQHKESYNINLYRNTAHIEKNFDYPFLKGLGNKNRNSQILNTASIIEHFSTYVILNTNNIYLQDSSYLPPHTGQSAKPQQIVAKTVKPKDTSLEELTRMEVPGHVSTVCKINTSLFAVGCKDPNDIFIVDAITLKIIRTLKHHSKELWRLYVHKKSGNLLSLSGDSSICVWEYSSGKGIKELKGHSDGVSGVTERNDGDIVTVCDGGSIKYWNMTEYKCYRTIENERTLYDVILKDNKGITCGFDGIKCFKEDAKSKNDYIYHNDCGGKWALSLGLVNNQGLVGCHGGWLLIYDVNGFKLQGELKGHSENVYCLILLGNGCVASGGNDNLLKIWDGGENQCKQTVKLEGAISNGGCGWDGNSVICGTWEDKAIKIFVRK